MLKSDVTNAKISAAKASPMKTSSPVAAPEAIAAARAPFAFAPASPANALHNRQSKREAERKLADFARHVPPSFQRPARFNASTTSGGM